MKKTINAMILLVLCSVSLRAASANEVNQGPLYPQGQNLVFLNTGKPFLVTAYGSVVPSSNNSNYDLQKSIQDIISLGTKYVRIWHLVPAEDNVNPDHAPVPPAERPEWPWMRTSVGSNQWNLDQWNPVYWERLKGALEKLTAAGVTAEIMFFDSCGLKGNLIGFNPFMQFEGVYVKHGEEGAEDSGYPSVYQNLSKLRERQRNYVRKMVQETAKYNVIYEIDNEHAGDDSADQEGNFILDMARTAREQLTKEGVRRAISYSAMGESDAGNRKAAKKINAVRESYFFNPEIDIVNLHYIEVPDMHDGDQMEHIMEIRKDLIDYRERLNKPFIVDEFGNDLGTGKVTGSAEGDATFLRRMTWAILVSGGKFHIEDAFAPAKPVDNIWSIKSFLDQTGFEFVGTKPEGHRAHIDQNNSCLASANGLERFCYYPTGGGAPYVLNIPPGNYRLFWWDPSSRLFYEGTIDATLIKEGVTPPNDTHDWVAYIIDSQFYQSRFKDGYFQSVIPLSSN
jgi:hypothetical protein